MGLCASIGYALDNNTTAPGAADVKALEAQALGEVRLGHFAAADQILRKAALSHDPAAVQMDNWLSGFNAESQAFAVERDRQYRELVSQANLLEQRGIHEYAISIAAQAYSLADDRETFRKQPWVDQLIKEAVRPAAADEQNGQWIDSLRVYSSLSVIDPTVPRWNVLSRLAARRLRLMIMYVPDELQTLQQSEAKARETVERLLKQSVAGAAAGKTPTMRLSGETSLEDMLKLDPLQHDWHDAVRGARLQMLWEALVDAHEYYYRKADYKALTLGGLGGLRTLVTTPGLEKTFPKLGDAHWRSEFLSALDKAVQTNVSATADSEKEVLRNTLASLSDFNRNSVELPPEVFVTAFADGVFDGMDPLTSIIWPGDLQEFGQQARHVGVGIQTCFDPSGSLCVAGIKEDTPAYNAGVKVGDIITQINDVITVGMSENRAFEAMTGPPGAAVRLTVRSTGGGSRTISLMCQAPQRPSIKGAVRGPAGGWDFLLDAQQKIGYIRITHFNADTPQELAAALDAMQHANVRGLIMDLRDNPGGLFSAVTDVADKFLDRGVIVRTQPDRQTDNAPSVVVAKPDQAVSRLPLVVLVNQKTAGGSEVLSGALQDLHRATLVGQRTAGAGSVQMLYPLQDRAAYLKITTGLNYLSSGRRVEREPGRSEWGITPDVAVPMTPDQMNAAGDARQELDILRRELRGGAAQPATNGGSADESTVQRKNLLARDLQLSAALLLLRLESNAR